MSETSLSSHSVALVLTIKHNQETTRNTKTQRNQTGLVNNTQNILKHSKTKLIKLINPSSRLATALLSYETTFEISPRNQPLSS